MVPDSTQDENGQIIQNPGTVEILSSNHDINPDYIRRLLRDSLSQLEVDPIPSEIIISDIVITRDSNRKLAIPCEISYFVESS